MPKEDWEWEDIRDEYRHAERDELNARNERYECPLCHNFHKDDTKLKWSEEFKIECCEDCIDDIEEFIETIKESVK